MVPDTPDIVPDDNESKANRYIDTPLLKRNQLLEDTSELVGELTVEMSMEVAIKRIN